MLGMGDFSFSQFGIFEILSNVFSFVVLKFVDFDL